MRRILTAYLAATFTSVLAALVGNWLAWTLTGYAVPDLVAVALVWLCCAGIPSAAWAHSNLARALGVKSLPELRIVSQRTIPIGDSVRSIFQASTRSGVAGALIIPDVLEFRYGTAVISEAEMFHFLATAWRRQSHGKAPLSRPYWVGGRHLDRATYDAHIALLRGCNLILGERKAGTRNRLRWSPSQTMAELKWRSDV